MKKLLLGSLALIALLIGGPAAAADIATQPVYKAAPIVSLASWTGFYIGGSLGGRWAGVNWETVTADFESMPEPTTRHASLDSASFRGSLLRRLSLAICP